jgi:3-keto-5-aminohexanoate cleavage enzyme
MKDNIPCIITVAITGSVPKKIDNPTIPITVSEQIESTRMCYEAGASLVHLHVRNEDESPSSDAEKFKELLDGIKDSCPKMIIQFSTGGRGRSQEERGQMLYLKPDMASLATGSVNFPTSIYENPPSLINDLAQSMLNNSIKPEVEIFDLAMLYNAIQMVKDGLLLEPIHVQFVFGIRNALPAKKNILEFQISELKKFLPQSTWTAAGLGKSQLIVNEWSLELGGHCRTGLEDNIKYDKTRLANGNEELVERLALLSKKFNRPVATPTEARKILGLGQV